MDASNATQSFAAIGAVSSLASGIGTYQSGQAKQAA